MKNYSDFIRTTLIFTQALIDTLLCWVSFHAVMVLWLADKDPAGFSPEILSFFTGTMLAVFYFNSLYEFRNWIFWDEVMAVLKSAALVLLIIVLYLYSQKFELSRFVICAGILFFVPLCLAARYIFRRVFFSLGLLVTHMIILGAGKTGELFAHKIVSHPFTSCKVAGFLDDDCEKQGKFVAGFPVLGRLEDFEKIYEQYHIEEAAMAISTAQRSLLRHILSIVEFRVKQVHYIPDMYMLTTFSETVKDVGGLPVISASHGLLNPLNRLVKSMTDYVGAAMALLIFSPVMLWAAYRIKREDGGDVFFRQERVGWKTNHFNVFKFRTMHPDAERQTEELLRDPQILSDYHKGKKLKNDPRLTHIGEILRARSIDELPQLFNVLKGEMSLVGPRTLIPKDVDYTYGDYIAKKIYTVKPGITGFWQISGRSEIETEVRKEMNLYYIRNWSLWLDIVIILRTIYTVFIHKKNPPE